MRKSYVVCAVLLVVSLLAGLALSAVTAAPIDDVEVQLQVIDGDPAAAEGLTLLTVYNYENLFWKTRLELGAEPTILSDFRLDKDESLRTDKSSGEWLAQPLAEGDNWLWWDEEAERREELDRHRIIMEDNTLPETRREEIVLQLAQAMGPNKEETFEVYLKDYTDFYIQRARTNNYYEWYYTDLLQLDYLEDLIRRPVEEDYCVAVTIRTDNTGAPMGVQWRETYYYQTYGKRAEGDTRPVSIGTQGGEVLLSEGAADGTFLAIELPESMEEIAQADWFPRGWGIFYVPWEEEPLPDGQNVYINGQRVESVGLPCYEKMELVLPLTWGEGAVKALQTSADGRCLQAVVCDKDGLWLVSIDADDRRVLERQQLPAQMQQAQSIWLFCEEDFLVVCCEDGTFAVYTLDGDGAARWQFTTQNPYVTPEGWMGYWNFRAGYGTALDYQDGKLAVCSGDLPWVQVYDETGLLCTAEYRLSLNVNGSYGRGLYSYYRGYMEGPQLYWQ